MKEKIKNTLEEYKCLMRSVPGLVTACFFLALICMNLLANKTIWTTEHTAADGGILIGCNGYYHNSFWTKSFYNGFYFCCSCECIYCNIV